MVPITTETQTSKTFFKGKRTVKKIQETISNIDNCTQDNDLCLIRKRQDVHDIRETNSADLFKPIKIQIHNNKHDESLSHITYTKDIINSLNMEPKSRKDNLHRINNGQHSPKSVKKYNTVEKGCTCNNTMNTVLNDMNSRNNRVTIVGRLGIDSNDKYILNCAATVNDKPSKSYDIRRKVCK